MNRLAIYVIFDADGIIDDYSVYLLRSLKEIAETLVVSNGSVREKSREKILAVADTYVERENSGFDAGAWKCAITKYVGFDALKNYDELLLVNDTFYGPFYPWADVLRKMDTEHPKADFWGLSVHRQTSIDAKKVCEHLQSYFIAVRRKMLHSREFFDYWEKQPFYAEISTCIIEHELQFTAHFASLGYKYAALADLRQISDIFSGNPYIYNGYRLLKYCGFPIIKRKLFYKFNKSFLKSESNTDETRKSIEYVADRYSYDMSLAYKNALRVANAAAIHNALDLNYILPRQTVLPLRRTPTPHFNAALIAFLNHPELYNERLEYIANLPEDVDVYLLADSKEKTDALKSAVKRLRQQQRWTIKRAAEKKCETCALLHTARDIVPKYDIFGFIHDEAAISPSYTPLIGLAVTEPLWENLFASRSYITNIFSLFADNPSIGLVVPPLPILDNFLDTSNNYWADTFPLTSELLKMLGASVHLSEAYEPLSLGNAFWARSDALSLLLKLEWPTEIFPDTHVDDALNRALERAYPYIAQSQGYLTATVMTETCAASRYELFREFYCKTKLAQQIQCIETDD